MVGLHLHSIGKEFLATLIATLINELLISNINRIEQVIALNWTEESTIMCINITDNHKPYLISTEDNLSKVLTLPTHFHNNQGNVANSESLHRTSNRQKKAPITRSNDSL